MNDNDIKDAFERMGPDPDAESRMLAAILEANAAAQTEHTAPAHKRAVWKIVLPIAACLALLAGIGVFAAASLSISSMNASLSASSEGAKLSADLSAESAAEKPPGLPSDESAADADPARTTPFIVLSEGSELRIATDDVSAPLIAEPALVGEGIGEAEAHDESGAASRSCFVYDYADDQHPYAVRYQGDSVLYLATPASE